MISSNFKKQVPQNLVFGNFSRIKISIRGLLVILILVLWTSCVVSLKNELMDMFERCCNINNNIHLILPLGPSIQGAV